MKNPPASEKTERRDPPRGKRFAGGSRLRMKEMRIAHEECTGKKQMVL